MLLNLLEGKFSTNVPLNNNGTAKVNMQRYIRIAAESKEKFALLHFDNFEIILFLEEKLE